MDVDEPAGGGHEGSKEGGVTKTLTASAYERGPVGDDGDGALMRARLNVVGRLLTMVADVGVSSIGAEPTEITVKLSVWADSLSDASISMDSSLSGRGEV